MLTKMDLDFVDMGYTCVVHMEIVAIIVPSKFHS